MGRSHKSGKSSVEVPVYHYSFHAGICHAGAGTELLSCYMGDKKFFEGSASTPSLHVISDEDFFGGYEREGGIDGNMHVLPGASNQSLFHNLAARLGLTPSTSPGYRGLFSVWFTGRDRDVTSAAFDYGSPKGFMVGANNPYLKPLSFRVRRPSPGLNATYQYIDLPVRRDRDDKVFESTPAAQKGYVQKTSNPAHVLYEIYTNQSWGDGRDPSTINKGSFEAAAQTLYNENFGISFTWYRQTEIKKIAEEIIDHIQASVYDDPVTGLLTIKLLRADYVTSALKSINPGNAKLTHFKRKLWGEVSSEVTVTWTNPLNEKEETVTAHNLAVSQAQVGSIVSSSRNFYMVRDGSLAARLAERELRSLSYPLAACDAEVHRSFGTIVPGDVLKLSWPEYNISELPMRVMEVLQGSSQSGKITLKLQEDIFGLPGASYLENASSQWDSERVNPVNPPVSIGTLPAYMTASISTEDTVGGLEYPTARVGILLERLNQQYTLFHVHGPRITPNGSEFGWLSANSFPTSATLATAITETTTVMKFAAVTGDRPRVNDFVFIGGMGASAEICVITAYDSATGNYTLKRGVLDTFPKAWPAAQKITITQNNFARLSDGVERSDGEQITLKLQVNTSSNQQDLADVTSHTVTLNDRAHRPLRPANVKVNGTGIGSIAAPPASGAIPVTWANRNRVTESQIVLAWTDASVAPETGQTTTIIVTTLSNGPIKTYSNIAGTSFNIPRADVAGKGDVLVKFQSHRDGFVSFTTPVIRLNGV